jgi:hypothetical protein
LTKKSSQTFVAKNEGILFSQQRSHAEIQSIVIDRLNDYNFSHECFFFNDNNGVVLLNGTDAETGPGRMPGRAMSSIPAFDF